MKLLKDLIKKRNIAPAEISEKDIFFVFQKIIVREFGQIGAGKLVADFWKDGKLFIKSKSPAFASELFMNRESVKNKINQELGEEIVREIKVK